jgi:ketosteroid isomerase-like protein
MSNVDVVRALMTAYLDQDREAAVRLIADDFAFTSPQDDHIDKATFFERCFPATTNLETHQVLAVAPADGDGVFVLYEYDSLQGDGRYRNAEFQTVRDGQVVETQVFFGGRVAT